MLNPLATVPLVFDANDTAAGTPSPSRAEAEAAVRERRCADRPLDVEDGIEADPVVPERAPELPAAVNERLAHRPAVGDLAMRLDPLGGEPSQSREVDDERLRLLVHRG